MSATMSPQDQQHADYREHARQLRTQGKSEREIAKIVGYAPSTVHEWVSDVEPGSGAEATPGQQTIDGGEVPVPDPGPEPVGEVRIDGLKQLGLIDFGGKHPQSSTLTLSGGQFDLDGAYEKGDRLFFAGQAQVFEITGRDKLDTKTMIPTTAVQKHTARIFDLHSGDETQVLVGMFRSLLRANRQAAIELADAFVREANGGA